MIWAKDSKGIKHNFSSIDELFDFINYRNDIVEGYVGG